MHHQHHHHHRRRHRRYRSNGLHWIRLVIGCLWSWGSFLLGNSGSGGIAPLSGSLVGWSSILGLVEATASESSPFFVWKEGDIITSAPCTTSTRRRTTTNTAMFTSLGRISWGGGGGKRNHPNENVNENEIVLSWNNDDMLNGHLNRNVYKDTKTDDSWEPEPQVPSRLWTWGRRHRSSLQLQQQQQQQQQQHDRRQPEERYHDQECTTVQLTSLRGRASKQNEVKEGITATINEGNEQPVESPPLVEGVTYPFVPTKIWENLRGDEFDHPDAMPKLAKTGLFLATQVGPNNPYVDWKPTKETERTLEESGSVLTALDQGKILVYVGKPKSTNEGHIGCHLPMIKTQSIIPLSSEEMAELLMDSSRVKLYNKLSLGRTDLRRLNDTTKIVRNLTKPPIASSNMISVTLMHSRPLGDDDQQLLQDSPYKSGHLVVSRAVPAAIEKEYADLPRNDILLGMNLLQDINPNECLMTAVTHVFSPSLPTMLAARLGVSSAMNFVKDIRAAVSERVTN